MKISIVTPCLNAEEFFAETLESIINQAGKFEIEYIIMDGKSTDRTVEIAKHYKEKIDSNQYPIQCDGVEIYVYSENDTSMYCALNKGFSKATGDLFAYLNADDIYLPGSLANVVSIFREYPDVFWLKGISSYIDCHGQLVKRGDFNMYTQEWIKQGKYGKEWYFISQDSVFWRSWLWKEYGGFNDNLKYSGDYHLWIKFSNCCPLYLTNFFVSCFRQREGQLSQSRNYGLEVALTSGRTNFLSKIFRKLIQLGPSLIKNIFAVIIYGNEPFYIVLSHKDKGFSKMTVVSKELIDARIPVTFF